jgi:hypothetical protein
MENKGYNGGILDQAELVWKRNGVVENDDERIFDERRVHNYEKGEESRLGIICCDVGVMRTVSVMMNKEWRGHKVVV